MNIEQWEEELYEEHLSYNGEYDCHCVVSTEDFKTFIRKLLEQQKKDSFVKGYNQALEDTGQKIKPERSHKAPDKV